MACHSNENAKGEMKCATPFDQEHKFSLLVCGADDALGLQVQVLLQVQAGPRHVSLLDVQDTVILLPVLWALVSTTDTQPSHSYMEQSNSR